MRGRVRSLWRVLAPERARARRTGCPCSRRSGRWQAAALDVASVGSWDDRIGNAVTSLRRDLRCRRAGESSTPGFVRSEMAEGRSSRSPPGRTGVEHLRRSVTVTSCGPGAAARAGPGRRMNSGARPGGGPSPAGGGLQLTNRSTRPACYPPAASDQRRCVSRPCRSRADMTILLLLAGSSILSSALAGQYGPTNRCRLGVRGTR
jgi:hypothetical protein